MAEGADVHMSENEDSFSERSLRSGNCCTTIAVKTDPQRPENSTLGVITESREALQGPITEPEPKNSTEAKRPEVSHNGGVNFESLEDALDDLEHDGALEDWHYYWLMQQGELP